MKRIPIEIINNYSFDNKANNTLFIDELLKTNFLRNLKHSKRIDLFFKFLEEYKLLIYGISNNNELLLYEKTSKQIYHIIRLGSQSITLYYQGIFQEYTYKDYWYIENYTFKTKNSEIILIKPECLISKIKFKFTKESKICDIIITYSNSTYRTSKSQKDYSSFIENFERIKKGIKSIPFDNIKFIIQFLKELLKDFEITENIDLNISDKESNKLYFNILANINFVYQISYKNITYSGNEKTLKIDLSSTKFVPEDATYVIELKNLFEK